MTGYPGRPLQVARLPYWDKDGGWKKEVGTEREWGSPVMDETPRCLLRWQYLIYCGGTNNYLWEIGLVPST
jgi:hypothetical protein